MSSKALEARCQDLGAQCLSTRNQVEEADQQILEAMKVLNRWVAHREKSASEYERLIEELEEAEDRLEAQRKSARKARRKLPKRPTEVAEPDSVPLLLEETVKMPKALQPDALQGSLGGNKGVASH